MEKFTNINKLLPYVDDSFQSFYDSLLKDERLAIFFKNDDQIQRLIKKQKESFVLSLDMEKGILKNHYIKLGEFHYDINIPYVDFIKGTEILQEHFLRDSIKFDNSLVLMDEVFEYFKIMKSFTAKGYLNRMLMEDKKDIESFLEQSSLTNESHLPKEIILEKLQWLQQLIYSIEIDEDFNFDINDTILKKWLKEVDFLDSEKRDFFEDLEKRLLINTQNLFYFLKRKEYLEILPLYTSLLSIYKLTLMMNNAITIEYAHKVIENMKIDGLTKLFRKEIFEEILSKEIALVQRDSNYIISVAYLDLDNFKKVNDNYGHYCGDMVIAKMGECIQENSRASDFGFRIGGDEFAIIFVNANKEQTKDICKKIQTSFTSHEFIFNDTTTYNVKISIGISEFTHHSKENLTSLLQSVDKKLYEAKDGGKNQISL